MYIGKHIVQLGRDLATTNDDYQILDDACEIAYNGLRSKSNSFVLLFTISWFWGLIENDMTESLVAFKGEFFALFYMVLFPISVHIALKLTTNRNNDECKEMTITEERNTSFNSKISFTRNIIEEERKGRVSSVIEIVHK
jgi:hypothetical protein